MSCVMMVSPTNPGLISRSGRPGPTEKVGIPRITKACEMYQTLWRAGAYTESVWPRKINIATNFQNKTRNYIGACWPKFNVKNC